jgi:hypothetical protein
VLQVAASALMTQSAQFKSFDLVTMAADDVNFTAEFELRPLAAGALLKKFTPSAVCRFDPPPPARPPGASCCAGLVVWFDTAFSARFCTSSPITLSTSPNAPHTHWAQTLFDFKVRAENDAAAHAVIYNVKLTRSCRTDAAVFVCRAHAAGGRAVRARGIPAMLAETVTGAGLAAKRIPRL